MTSLVLGFIGLGVMGEPMCRHLCTKSGYRVVVHDIDPAPVARLVGHGAVAADSVAAVTRACDVLFVSLPSGRELDAVVRGPGGVLASLREGQVFVDLGTSPVKLTREFAALVEAAGCRYLDAPVARTRQAAESGTLSVMVGGDAEVFAQLRPLIALFASDITHCGGHGTGQMAKIFNNLVLFQTVAALSEVHAIARRAGCDVKLIFETIAKGSGDSFALRNHGMKAITPREFPLRAFSVDYAMKDLSYALELAEETGVDAAGARRVAELFRAAAAAGDGAKYFPVVSRVVDGEV